MTDKSQNLSEIMQTQRVDQLVSTGTATKQDVDDVIMSVTQCLESLKTLNLLELPASALRLINDAQRQAYNAKVAALNAQYKLRYGK